MRRIRSSRGPARCDRALTLAAHVLAAASPASGTAVAERAAVVRFGVLALLLCGPTALAQPVDPYWTPVDDAGWPRGHSMETLRALRGCQPGELSTVEPGAAIPCRPAALVGTSHLAFAIDWTTGVALDDRTSGGAQALGVELGYAVTRSLQLAGRYEVMGYGDTMTTATGVSQHVLGLAKWRLFTDEVDRDAWTLGLGGGWAFRDAMLGGGAPLARASIAREVGLYVDDNNTVNAAIELAYERALDERGASAVLGSLRFGFELDVREPENLGSVDDDRAGSRHRTAFDLLVSSGLGLGLSVALHATERIALVSSATYLFGDTQFKQQSFDGASWAVQAGPQLALLDHWATPYVGVQAGAAWYSQPEGLERLWIATPELGVRLQSCNAKIDLGAWLRTDIVNDFDVIAGGAVIRGAFGGCGGRGAPRFATPYVPPPPPPAPPVIERPAVAIDTRVDVGVEVGGSVAVEVKPVVVEVQLGAALLGGALSVRVDARLLPLDRLRGAGFVEIELTGPVAVLQRYQAELGTTLGRAGARVDAWAVVPTGDSIVRAKLTIWPPGSRPR